MSGYCPVFVGVLGIVKRSQLTSGKLDHILECPPSSSVWCGSQHSSSCSMVRKKWSEGS